MKAKEIIINQKSIIILSSISIIAMFSFLVLILLFLSATKKNQINANFVPEIYLHDSDSSSLKNQIETHGLDQSNYEGIGASFLERQRIIKFESLSAVEKYDVLIIGAEQGVGDAQYLLSEVFLECSRVVDDELLEKIKNSPDLPDEYYQELLSNKNICDGFEAYAASKSVAKETGLAWLVDSASNGNPLSKLELNMTVYSREVKNNPKLKEETRLLVYAALEHSKDNPVLMKRAVWQGVRYFSRYVESQTIKSQQGLDFSDVVSEGYNRGATSEAWRLISCSYTTSCNMSDQWEMLKASYYEYEVNEIRNAAINMTKAIRNSEWDVLALKVN
ncbi:hypothetical protein [Halioxenophilus sp. WMMB6]|uniref:hypothetical protein n=1 Tax=Halioxenophilus sp. WMMB6 TaxID=3073815 RepID=UPI00295F52B4|nr:hypothetical protein [Halioxenophilus sp. WMMB6]